MKINFDTWSQNPGVDKTTTSQGVPGFLQEQKSGAYAMDISGIVMDNNAYKDHGRSSKEVMQDMGVQLDNLSAQRDYMTVMSNIMSTEDFNKMMKDGFKPSALEPEQVVTILDHIKAEIAKSGKVVTGYNDDLSQEELTEILGSASLAKEVEKSFQNAGMPLNEENMNSVKETLDKASKIRELDDAGKKYMLENHLEPTVENIYRANFSAQGDGTKQSRGYFSQEMPGYYAKKAEVADWKTMEPQIEKTLEKMELNNQSKEESMEQAKWLISKGIPVTQQSMSGLQEIRSLSLPLKDAEVIEAAVRAMVKGKASSEGLLTGEKESIYQKANRITEDTKNITKDAVMEAVSENKELTIQNLAEVQKKINTGEIAQESFVSLTTMIQEEVSVKYVQAARTLAEVQLRMTIDANIRLLKSDYSIDTVPLTELVEELRKQEEQLSVSFFGKENAQILEEKAALFNRTESIVKEIPFLPAAVIGKITETKQTTLSMVHAQGTALRAQYLAAEESYEALMTKPRADLGDSIRKAFINVDDILQDMGQELSEDNRKAVRILGYNSTEITQEAISNVKETALLVENVVKSMTPQRTLAMIREGVNPLTMSLDELEIYLNNMDRAPEEETAKYAGFLYELEKNGQITDSERDAYIGVYRLFHQIEKSDGAVIGSLLNQGSELTLGNLLTAVRNRKARKMDYTIDGDFGLLTKTETKGNSISAQIENGIAQARQAHAVFRDLSVDKLQQMNLSKQTTLSELRDALAGMTDAENMDAKQEMMQNEKQIWEAAFGAERDLYEVLRNQGISLSPNNVYAAKELYINKGKMSEKVKDYAKQLEKALLKEQEGFFERALENSVKSVTDYFTDYESAQNAMEIWENNVETVLNETMSEVLESTKDMKEISLYRKQLSLMRSMRRQENYEVPMEINGELTSVNLVLVHNAKEKGLVSVTLDTENFGKAGVKFRMVENTIDSFFVADSEKGKERLMTIGEQVLQELAKKGLEIGETNYVNVYTRGRKEFNFLTFSESDVDNNNRTVATKQLYEVAKIFLTEIQKVFV